MMRFHPKLGSETGKEWRCFLCLHVRTGTIFIGLWHLILHLLALAFVAAIVRDARRIEELQRDSNAGSYLSSKIMTTPLSTIDQPLNPYPQHGGQQSDHALVYHDVDMGALVTVCTLALTLMLIYGAVRGKPSHLLPFFCLQIFDFVITVLSATGYLCYLRSIHHVVSETRRVPWRAELLQLPAPALALIVISFFILAVFLKGYCINVVWRCYKYCTWRVSGLQHSRTPFVISSDGLSISPDHLATAYATPAPDYSSLLPDYEEAVKQVPPPSYRDATLMAVVDPEAATLQPKGSDPPPFAQAVVLPVVQPAVQPVVQPAVPPVAQPVPSETIVVLPQAGEQSRV